MKKKKKFVRFLKLIYIKIFRINDTPQKIALGLGLGVFSGIMPGMGPLIAITLALILRSNRASALLGSLLTNTWISFLTFFLALKTGSLALGTDWQVTYQNWINFLAGFRWLDLFKVSILKIILPIITGYLIIAFCLGLLAYVVTLTIILIMKTQRKYASPQK
ncbi:MAG: DUF2062 domain-containing protein [Candidatus Omnitrophica bacterium]|nr:DUF2062 domain-containing protein [Candidatus Omnitrophota bacterium]MDD5238718.1 DUF2062 domain-containing protein [Candidatus Omnitrophota bacterium]